MKPLFRWTIGPVNPLGFTILKKSVHSIKKLYDFDFVICHNQLNNEQKTFVNSLGVRTYEQKCELKYPPQDVAWKLCPPRLSNAWKLCPPRLSNAHEIWMDNDIIIYKKIKQLDQFLEEKDSAFATEGLLRNFGSYDHFLPAGFTLNSGFFGLPPNFDFSTKIEQLAKPWTNRFDEQGLVATIIHQLKHYLIPLTDISVSLHSFIETPYGCHFVGANQGNKKPWQQYMENCFKCLAFL